MTFRTATLPIWPAGKGFSLVVTLTRSLGATVWFRFNVEPIAMGALQDVAGLGQRTLLFVKIGNRGGVRIAGANAQYLFGRYLQYHFGQIATVGLARSADYKVPNGQFWWAKLCVVW